MAADPRKVRGKLALSLDEFVLLSGKRDRLRRLGFAVLLKFFDQESRFLESEEEVQWEAVSHVARQIVIAAGDGVLLKNDFEEYEKRLKSSEIAYF